MERVALRLRERAGRNWRETCDVQIQPYTTNIKIGGGIICGTMSGEIPSMMTARYTLPNLGPKHPTQSL